MSNTGRAATLRPVLFAPTRATVLLVLACATILVGLVIAGHSETPPAAAPPTSGESTHADVAHTTDVGVTSAQPLTFDLVGGACLLLALCCGIVMRVRGLGARASRSGAPRGAPSPTASTVLTRPRMRPLLHQLSISRT